MPSKSGSLKPGQQGPVQYTREQKIKDAVNALTSGGGSKSYVEKVSGGGVSGGGESGRLEYGSYAYKVAQEQALKSAEAAAAKKETERIAAEQKAAEQQAANIKKQAQAAAEQQKKILAIEYGTKSDLGNINVKLPSIKNQPYIERRVKEQYYDKSAGRNIPITNLVYVDPTGLGVQKERPVTKEEREYFESATKELEISTEKAPAYKPLIDSISLTGEVIKERGDEAINLRKLFGFSKEQGQRQLQDIKESTEYLKEQSKQSTAYLKYKGVNPLIADLGGDIAEFSIEAGGTAAAAFGRKGERVLDQPFEELVEKPVILGAAGYGLGYLFEGVPALAAEIPAAGRYAGPVLKGAGAAIGGGLTVAYAGGKAAEILTTEDILERGDILGETSEELILLGAGFKSGRTGVLKTKGLLATRGREYLEIEQGDYPNAPANKQVNLFKENIIEELGEKPGAFHTTSERFWTKDFEIVPNAGSSELPGLYGSTKISRPFSRISGSSEIQEVSFDKKLQSLFKDIFEVQGKPGVAYIKPKGFRYSPTKDVEAYEIDEQTFRKAFKLKAEKGVADIPLIKEEIEAIFRPETGPYKFKSGKYFTIIKGIRVPIDVFEFEGVETPPRKSFKSKRKFLKGGKSSYELPSDISEFKILSELSSYDKSLSSSKLKSNLKSPSKKESSIRKYSSLTSSFELSNKDYGLSLSRPSSKKGKSKGPYSSNYEINERYLTPKKASIKTKRSRNKRQRTTPKGFEEDISYEPDFTSKSLGLTKRVSKKQARKIIKEREGLGLRPILLIENERRPRNKNKLSLID